MRQILPSRPTFSSLVKSTYGLWVYVLPVSPDIVLSASTLTTTVGDPRSNLATAVMYISLLLTQWSTKELWFSAEEKKETVDITGMSLLGSMLAAMWKWYFVWMSYESPPLVASALEFGIRRCRSEWLGSKGDEIDLSSIVSHHKRHMLSAQDVNRTFATTFLFKWNDLLATLPAVQTCPIHILQC